MSYYSLDAEEIELMSEHFKKLDAVSQQYFHDLVLRLSYATGLILGMKEGIELLNKWETKGEI